MTDFTGTDGDDTLVGTTGDDNFDITQGGNDIVIGGGGDDTVSVQYADYFTFNSNGTISLFHIENTPADNVATLTGVKYIDDEDYDASLQLGTVGNDTVTESGAYLHNYYYTGSGNDTINVTGNSWVDGGTGRDTIVVAANSSSSYILLTPYALSVESGITSDSQQQTNFGIANIGGGSANVAAVNVEFVQFTDRTIQILYGVTQPDGAEGIDGAAPVGGGAGLGAEYAASVGDVVQGLGSNAAGEYFVRAEAVAGDGGWGGNAIAAGNGAVDGAGGQTAGLRPSRRTPSH